MRDISFLYLLFLLEELIDTFCCVTSARHGPHHERCTVRGIATDKDILCELWLLWLQESHCEEAYLTFDDLWLASLDHNGAAAFWVRLPVDRLHADTCQLAILTEKLQRVDVPASCTTFLVG